MNRKKPARTRTHSQKHTHTHTHTHTHAHHIEHKPNLKELAIGVSLPLWSAVRENRLEAGEFGIPEVLKSHGLEVYDH